MTANYLVPSEWRLSRFGIPVKLLERSGTFGGLDDISTAKEKYLIPATSLLAFASGTFPKPFTAGNKICQLTSQMPGLPFMRSKRITWKAHVDGKPIDPFNTDPTADALTYGPVVEVDVEYRSSNQEDEGCIDDPRTFLEIIGNTTGEFLHAGAGNCWWSPDRASSISAGGTLDRNKNPNVPVTLTVPHTEWTLRWPLIFGPFFEEVLVHKLRARMGKVNIGEFNILFNAAPETVLFVGYDYREHPIFTGETVDTLERALFVEVDMKFVEKHVVNEDGIIIGHNHFWREGIGWQYVSCGTDQQKDDGQLKPLYTRVDMNDLFSTQQGCCTYQWDGSVYQLVSEGCLGGWRCPDDAPVLDAGVGVPEVGSTTNSPCVPP